MLNIGYMDYANVYPIFYFLLKDKNLKFTKGYPAFLNKEIRESRVDISPSSSIEFARNHDLYKIIPNICVSSIGPVKSVNLYSKYKVEDLNNKKVYWTKESNTSTVLCRIILEKFYNLKPIYTSNEDEADASLLIGDKALFEYYKPRKDFIIDLGEEWYNHTSLPFTFALWIARKNLEETEELKGFVSNLHEIVNNFPKDSNILSSGYIEKGYTLEQLDDYWNTIRYNITEDHIKGLKLFFDYAYSLGETHDNAKDLIETSFIKF